MEREINNRSEGTRRGGVLTEPGRSLAAEVFAHPWVEDSVDVAVSEQAARSKALEKARLLWQRRRFLARTTVLGIMVATVLAFLIPKHYTAMTRLMPPDQQSGMGTAMLAALAGRSGGSGATGGTGGGGGLAALAGDVLGMKTSGDLFVGILRSRTVQEDLVRKFDLRKVYGERFWEDACKDLDKQTEIEQDRKSGIITISVTDKDPLRAAEIAGEYSAQLNRAVTQLNTSSAHRERMFLEERLKEIKQDLEDAEKEFSQFSSKNTAIDIKEQGKAMVEAAALLQGQLIAAQSQLEGLRQIYTENNSRVKATQAQVAELKKQLERLGGGDSSNAAGVEEGGSLYPSIRKLPLLGVTYADLYRRTKVDEVVFEGLTQQYELAKVQEAKDTPSVKVLDVAKIPEKKSFPPRLVLVLLGGLFSFVFGSAWSLAKVAWLEVDASDPKKLFAQELVGGLKADLYRGARNGSPESGLIRSWKLYRRRQFSKPERTEGEPTNLAANDK
jgi:uncharacterized protein involved in exopolysaccharide biosynthesis